MHLVLQPASDGVVESRVLRSEAGCVVHSEFNLTFKSYRSTYAILGYLGGLVGAALFCSTRQQCASMRKVGRTTTPVIFP
jgi:hypothetical protein